MKKSAFAIVGTVAGVLWLIWALPPAVALLLGHSWALDKWGQWGDSFGGLNALFSAAAFVAVLHTIRMQSKEIVSQQAEIEQQTLRIERSEREAQLKQFESTFFQLFELFRELRNSVNFVPEVGPGGVGREAFEAAYADLLRRLFPDTMYSNDDDDALGIIERAYSEGIHRRAEGSLGPYFRILYTILRRISESKKLTDEDKAQYGNLIRSQLSSVEVALIAANALTESSNDFAKFVIEFRLLKYLPESQYRAWLEKIYPTDSFTARD
ncbi:putative phage abortive infection protein [Rhizobium leguminosarum]|uniref:putative phage abortive infection protein n=1 Tax=Rhizobium leguminosarum TaxID=384 RepID=UPI0004A4BEF6|nr:putative phage abortive infection protein [Rhizobium leguminosarum]